MLDHFTVQECKSNPEVLELKIKNLEHAIKQSEMMISESTMDEGTLIQLKRKIANSLQELEALYLLKNKSST